MEKTEEKKLVRKNNDPMPPRTEIRRALMNVSDFTEDEIAIMYWSSLYKAYSLIVRYEQKGVEEEMRAEEWFAPALEEYRKKKGGGDNMPESFEKKEDAESYKNKQKSPKHFDKYSKYIN